MKFKNTSAAKRVGGLLVLGAAMLVGTSATSFAQGHNQGQERRVLKDHQRQERYNNGNDHQTRDHQKQERDQLKNEQHIERNSGYSNNGSYYDPRYNNGGYYRNGHANNGYYNNGRNNGSYNNGHSNGGYYGGGQNNGGYYDPRYSNGGYSDPRYNNGGYYGHRDSRSRIRRGIHHALGGH